MKNFMKSVGIIFLIFSSIAIVICSGAYILDKAKLNK